MAVNRPGVLGAVLRFVLGSLYILLQIPLSCKGSGAIRMDSVKAHDQVRISSDNDTLEVRRQIGIDVTLAFVSHRIIPYM